MTFSIVIMVGRGYFLPTHVHEASNYAMYPATGQAPSALTPEADKKPYFNNYYENYDLIIEKKVQGNQADLGRYFKITAQFSGEKLMGTYVVDLSGAQSLVSQDGQTYTNSTAITLSGQGATQDFWIKDGQRIEVRGLSWKSSYSIAEAPEEYEPTLQIVNPQDQTTILETKENTASVSGEETSDTYLRFVNEKKGTIPTGVVMSVLPGAAILLIGGLGILYFVRKRK